MRICTILGFLLLTLFTHTAVSQPKYESSVTNIGAESTATISKPTGTSENDLLVIGLMYEKGSDENFTPPSGWILIRRTDNSTELGMVTYYKYAGPSEPSNYSIDLEEGSKWSIGISRISNVDEFSPIHASAGNTGNGTAVSSPSINTSANNKLVLVFYTNKDESTYTPAASSIERYDAPNTDEGQPSNMMATIDKRFKGSTGDVVATATGNVYWVSQQVALSHGSPLPVKFTGVRAEANMAINAIHINWSTAMEINNEYFSVERSLDGISFESIGTVEGAGTTSSAIDYSFTDDNPVQGMAYYRIKQTDFNGEYDYSDIVTAEMNTATDMVSVYPNPVSGSYITANIQNVAAEADYVVTSIAGQMVKSGKIDSFSGSRIDLSELNAGLYFITFDAHGKKEIESIIIQ